MRQHIRLLAVLLALSPIGNAAAQHRPSSADRAAGARASPQPSASARANPHSSPRTVEIALTAGATRLSLVPGAKSDVYAYNGSIPGPTLDLREGDRVIVHFRNRLPEPTTVHWHGLHLPFTADGSPFRLVAPGESYTYDFTVRPGSAGTYWCHPHPHHHTGAQVARGLYGAVIVRAPDDPLPASLPERVLLLSDNRIRPDGSLDLPDPQGECLHAGGDRSLSVPHLSDGAGDTAGVATR